MKNKIAIAAVLLGLVVISGLAYAHPEFNERQNMEMQDADENSIQIKMTEEMINFMQQRLAFLKGEISEEDFEDAWNAHREKMEDLMKEGGYKGGCPMMKGMMMGGGMGSGMGMNGMGSGMGMMMGG